MAFVTHLGAALQLSGSAFRFAGCNLWWAGLIQLSGGTIRYPTIFEIDDGLNTAKEMGASVVRSHTLGVSVGSSLTAFPTLASLTGSAPNTAAFNSIDYAIYRAGQLGIRLIIPLCDHNRYYYGGKHTFTDWRSLSDESQFYTNSTVIADFESYISQWLNRVNQYNSLAYKNDPAILCWETINEGYNPFPGATWTDTISTYIKSIDSNHLVMDGSYGVQSGNLSLTNVDIYSNHHYPPQIALANSDATSTSGASKAYVIGEIDWRPGITGGAGTQTIDNTTAADGTQSCQVVVQGTSANLFNVQIQQKNLSLVSGKTYTCTFYAKSSINQTIQVGVQKAVTPFTTYTLQNVVISTTWTQYTITWSQGVSDANAQVAFNLAGDISTIWLDMVSITASGISNIVLNPSFENDPVLIAPWSFVVITTTPDSYPSFATAIEGNTNVSGDIFWQLMPHNNANGFTLHGDGYSLYYPVGITGAQATQAQVLRTHAYNMQGVTVPAAGLITKAPTITSNSIGTGSPNSVTWQGIVGANAYRVERGPTAGGPWSTLSTTATDFSTPFSDASMTANAWYRVTPINVDGKSGPASTPVGGNISPYTPIFSMIGV